MSIPSPEQWGILSALLDEALELTDDGRAQWLARQQSLYPELAPQLAELMAARDSISRNGFLENGVTPPPLKGGSPGAVCGPYVLESLIGRGGMGSVWRASRHDGRYNTTVAIKLLSSALLDGTGERRFRREGQILARLRHAHIAQLLDAGITKEGQPFLVLEYIDGTHIDAFCRARSLDTRARVSLLQSVMSAVSHAHSNLVVHRDLKPSNILVDTTGQVKLLDFGIAKLLDDDDGLPTRTALTHDGGQLLTPLYASPEQITGAEVTTATDIYALGIVLCELLTGAPPYRLTRESRGALEEAILTGDPLRPSELVSDSALRRTLRGDLDTIILKALRKAPTERYSSVSAFADDLQAWLDERPVRARPDSLRYRTSRFIRRNTLGVAAGGMVAVAIIAGAGVALWQASLARTEQRRAEEITTFVTGIFENADPDVGAGTQLTATDLLRQAYARLNERLTDRPDLRLELLWLIGGSLKSLQEYADAEPMLREVAATSEQLYGVRDERTLRAQVAVARLYRLRGELDSMESSLSRAIREMRTMPKVDPELLVSALVATASLAIDRGTPREAVEPAREAMQLADATLPPTNLQRVDAAVAYAVALQHGGTDRSAAVDAATYARDAALAAFDNMHAHPRVIDAEMALAQALGPAGRPREAIEVLRRADSASIIGLGADNFMRAFIRGNMATQRVAVGQERQALVDYNEALRVFRANGDTVSVNYGIQQGHRGTLLLRAQQYGEALPLLREALAAMERAIGEGHPRVLTVRMRAAIASAHLGRSREVDADLAQVRAHITDSASPRAVHVSLLHTLGVVAHVRGNAAEAVQLLDSALRVQSDSAPAVERAPIQVDLGLALLASGAMKQAERTLQAALEAFRGAELEISFSEEQATAALARMRATN